MKYAFVLAFVVLCGGAAAVAQRVAPETLLNPPADSWLTYHGDYSGKRHSTLTAITYTSMPKLSCRRIATLTGSPLQLSAPSVTRITE